MKQEKSYVWRLFWCDREAIRILKLLRPFVMGKKDVLELGLQFEETMHKRGEKLSLKDRNLRKILREKISYLNRRN